MFASELEEPEAVELAEALAAVFEREADALRAAAFEALDAIAEEKEHLAGQLAEVTLARPTARRLQGLAMRNMALLQAARTGLQAAADRIAAIASPAPLQTYDGQGRRATLGGPAPQSGRRA